MDLSDSSILHRAHLWRYLLSPDSNIRECYLCIILVVNSVLTLFCGWKNNCHRFRGLNTLCGLICNNLQSRVGILTVQMLTCEAKANIRVAAEVVNVPRWQRGSVKWKCALSAGLFVVLRGHRAELSGCLRLAASRKRRKKELDSLFLPKMPSQLWWVLLFNLYSNSELTSTGFF